MTKLPDPKITPYGDAAIHLEYEAHGYSAAANKAVLSLAHELRASGDWQDVVCGYHSLVAVFHSHRLTSARAAKAVQDAVKTGRKTRKARPHKVVEIPVYYGGENGPDMEVIARSSGLTEAEIIKTHSAELYDVCMMGFIPGFTFLSEAPKALHHPRRAAPRLSVPSGSVGIAGWQTGIYGLSSPGGWQIIGRTDLQIFDASRETPFLLSAGDKVRFIAAAGISAGGL